MAGTIDATQEYTSASVKKVLWTWTSSAGGAVDATTTKVFNGEILAFGTIPNPAGTVGCWPTDNYDIVVRDSDGFDVLTAGGADRDISGEEAVAETSLGAVCNSTLTLAITNAGDSKKGSLSIWIR